MGGRFGKYGDAKRKALIRKNRLRPSAPCQKVKGNPVKGPRNRKDPSGIKGKPS